jgi:RNA polymerase sigma-54 factor
MLLQLKRLADKDSIHKTALEVVKTYFDDFSKKKYELVKKKMELSEDDFEKVKEVITSLNPIPSNLEKYNTKIQHLAPDFIVTIDEDNHFNVELAYYNYPSLKVNKKYEKMLNSKDVSMEFLVYMKNNITSAIQFIKAIQKRKETLLSTIEIIVEKQRNFFLTGDKSTLVPMQLKTIAEEVNVDISTISRIVNSKSVQTFFGIFLLKVLFSEGIPGEGGESVSNIVVRDVLKEVIDKEDKKKPYSDIQLVKILTERGYKIARRTVTKYRESLNIPVARLRKN